MNILAVLLIALAIFVIVRGSRNIKYLKHELADAEKDADTYARELAFTKEDYEDLEYACQNHINGTYSLEYKGLCKFQIIRHTCDYHGKEHKIVIKTFPYQLDGEDRELARLEAEDLLDALNGKIGWRVNEDIG